MVPGQSSFFPQPVTAQTLLQKPNAVDVFPPSSGITLTHKLYFLLNGNFNCTWLLYWFFSLVPQWLFQGFLVLLCQLQRNFFLTLKFVLGAATLLITLSFMSFLLFVVFHLSCYYGTHCSVISHSP